MSSSLPIAPAPWTLTGSGWTFLLRQPFSTTPVPLPQGAHHPFEQGSLAEQWQSSSFHGGVGMVMVVRYDTSAVGPYDELIYVPGLFSRKGRDVTTTYSPSITNIYVSSPASVMNGRKNWGIPKHHALFTFTPTPTSLSLTVSHPTTPPTPFFRALLTPSSLPFSLPLQTSWLSTRLSRSLLHPYSLSLLQPPLSSLSSTPLSRGKAGVERAVEGEVEESLVASEGWFGVSPECKGWCRGFWMGPVAGEEGWEGMGDARGFPEVRLAYKGFGVRSEFVMTFPVAEVVEE